MGRWQNASCRPNSMALSAVGSVGPEDVHRALFRAEQGPRLCFKGPSNADLDLKLRRLPRGPEPAGRSIFGSTVNCWPLVRQSGQICLVILFAARQQAGHLKHLFAQARIRNGKVGRNEIARLSACHQVCQMPRPFVERLRRLPQRNHAQTGRTIIKISEEPGNRYPQLQSDLVQAGGADAGLAGFVFLHLLSASSEPFRQSFLAQTQQDPAQSDPSADVLVDQVRLLGKNAIRYFLSWRGPEP